MKNILPVALSTLVPFLPAGAACYPELPEPPGVTEPQPPRARLKVPVRFEVGREIILDASPSYDADGVIVEYRFRFADGTADLIAGTATASHAYRQIGSYAAGVTVIDNDGMEDAVLRTLEVQVAKPDPSCGPEAPCPPSETCGDDGLCCYPE
jgi:hypothetical protein